MPKKGGKKSRGKGSSKNESHAVDHAVRSALKQARGKKVKLGYSDSLQKDLASIGLAIQPVRSDGNCLFGAISDQLYGTQDRHEEVRAAITSHMESSADDYRWFVDEDQAWEEYLAEMKQDGTWGGNIEVQAASMTLKVNIVVHQCDEHVPRMVVRNWADAAGKPARTLHLAYHGAEHYNSVRLRSDIVEGQPALQFDLDSLIASGGTDPGEVAAADAAVAAHSASAKAAVCPDLQELHGHVVADVDGGVALPHLHTPVVSKLLRNTAHFQGRTRVYVAALLQRVQGDEVVATECLNRIPFEVVGAGAAGAAAAAVSVPAEATPPAPAAGARTKARMTNKERRALRKAAKFEKAAAKVQLSAAAASGGSAPAPAPAASVQRAVQAAAAAALQRGSGKRVASTFTDKQSLDI